MQPGLPKNICSSRLGFGITTGTAMHTIPIGRWSLQMPPGEMARLGYLYLHAGDWNGKQIVSAGWVQTATQPRFVTGGQDELRYGYQWWIYPRYGAYAALGREGQTVFVVPEKDLLIVTTAGLNGHAEIFRLIEKYILSSVDAQIR